MCGRFFERAPAWNVGDFKIVVVRAGHIETDTGAAKLQHHEPGMRALVLSAQIHCFDDYSIRQGDRMALEVLRYPVWAASGFDELGREKVFNLCSREWDLLGQCIYRLPECHFRSSHVRILYFLLICLTTPSKPDS
uniref:Uncharacterized protein n=1 Tax=Ralstonia solanacearum TaxID=305 RepID=A0A0S4WZA0_RALSL|nr:protein of unknown function [Ralstonia solanacearum]